MAESIRKFKNNDEIISDLEKRDLVFVDAKSKQIFKTYLIQYGYFSFVKNTLNDLMYRDKEKKLFKKEFTSNNLRYLFDIDRNISNIVFKYFRCIEFFLNSSLLKVIGKNINKLTGCPYIAALSDENINVIFGKIAENMSTYKKKNNNMYLELYNDIFKNFKNHAFDCKMMIKKNMDEENEEIKQIIKKGWLNKLIYSAGKKNIKFLENWEYLDIFSLFQTLSFSQLLRLFSYLSTSLKNEVVKEFFSSYNNENKKVKLTEEYFNTLIHIFASLRNILMHNGSMIKFNYEIDEITKEKFQDYFKINIPNLEIKLNEIMLIMEKIININNLIFEEINQSIKSKFSNSNRSNEISDIILDIIENESRINIKIE